MQLSLVDVLRCPAHSPESTLVLTVERWAGPRVAEGELGCPVCHARYPIHEGSVDFVGGELVRRSGPVAHHEPMRLLAQLNLSDPGGLVLLAGTYGVAHGALTTLVDITCLLVDTPPTASPRAVNFALKDRVPLAARVLRGAAVDSVALRMLPDLLRCLIPGGRLVAPASAPLPAGVRLIARDESEWVAEVEDIQTIQIRRPDRPSGS